MAFGRRFSIFNAVPAPKIQLCSRCKGTGHVMERGHQIACKICLGAGSVTTAPRFDDNILAGSKR